MTYDEAVESTMTMSAMNMDCHRKARWQTISRAELRLMQFYPSFHPPR